MAKLTRLSHLVFGCRGYVDHYTDDMGNEWVGLRCTVCGRITKAGISIVQRYEAGRRSLDKLEG